ncbi:MAG: MBL fold metallo-hydrolase [bacterium]|nr:MBL fold metallo-hydrolase [bacterium]
MEKSNRQWHFTDSGVAVDKIVTGPLDNNVYLIVSVDSNDSVIVDAASNAAQIIDMAEGTDVGAVLTTHGHWDHVGATAQVATTLAVPASIGPEDLAISKLDDATALDEGPLVIGGLTLEIIATPGHTQGSRCIKVGNLLFTGDTLFPGGPGATQNAGHFAQIMNSLDTKLFTLADATRILPGHGLDTTIGAERGSVEDWRSRGW